MERVLSIVRSEAGLVEVVATFRGVEWARPTDAAGAIAADPRRVVIERRPVPATADLHGLWDRSGRSRRPDAAMVRDALELIGATVLARPRMSGTFVRPPYDVKPFRATAAHPRAYKGTQDRRPTPPSEPPVVLADVLLDPRATRSFLEEHADVLTFDQALIDLCGFDGAGLTPEFRELVWSQVRHLPASLVARAISILRTGDDASLAASAWLIATRGAGNAIPWLEWAFGLPDELRGAASAVLGGFDPTVTFGAAYVDWLPESGAAPARFAMELQAMLGALSAGVDPTYRRAGIELMREIGSRIDLLSSPVSGEAPVATLRAIGEMLVVADIGAYSVISAWDACGRAPELGRAIAERAWAELEPHVAMDLLLLLGGGLSLDEYGTLANATWSAAHAATFEAAARGLAPDRASKFLEEMLWIAAAWDADVLRRRGDAAIALARRLADAPFKSAARPVWAWNSFLEYASDEQARELVELPDRTWRAVDSACTRRNQEAAITAGIDDLAKALGPRTIEFMRSAPASLMKTARSIGLLSDASRAALVADWHAAHAAETPREALTALDAAMMQTALSGVGVADSNPADAVLHAALLRRSITPNRRALGRFLKRYLAGENDYLDTHPLTRRWVERHPDVRIGRATRAEPRVVELPELGTVTIAVETNPLEVLRLGTYVGSCLSLGGAFDYSAAAVALDVNKLVVYARNRRGSVVARQLLAVSDDERLVRFEIYPASAPDAVSRELAAFAEVVANELGVPMLPDDAAYDSYEVELVVAHEWWDDGPA